MTDTTTHPSLATLRTEVFAAQERVKVNDLIIETIIYSAAMMPDDTRMIMQACAVTEKEYGELLRLRDDDDEGENDEMDRDRLAGTINYLYLIGALTRRGVPGHGVYYRTNLAR